MSSPLTLEAFRDWAATKAGETYSYIDFEDCAVAQYARSIGQEYRVPIFRGGGYTGEFWHDAEKAAEDTKVVNPVDFVLRQRRRFEDLVVELDKAIIELGS